MIDTERFPSALEAVTRPNGGTACMTKKLISGSWNLLIVMRSTKIMTFL